MSTCMHQKVLRANGITSRILLESEHIDIFSTDIQLHSKMYGNSHPDILLHKIGRKLQENGYVLEAKEAYSQILYYYQTRENLTSDHPNILHTKAELEKMSGKL
mmetsp:Transcript_9324/g.20615  ORF Transcript_9324/g.20615 Transcript_9324/m.20615 type:complete len:104 (-) Transcript_9324:401-712(-)